MNSVMFLSQVLSKTDHLMESFFTTTMTKCDFIPDCIHFKFWWKLSNSLNHLSKGALCIWTSSKNLSWCWWSWDSMFLILAWPIGLMSPDQLSQESWLVIMYVHLSPLISWSTCDALHKTMSQCFVDSFGYKTTVIIDCFEIFIDRPTNLMARAQTFSNYKHHNTVKVLIGISPRDDFICQWSLGRSNLRQVFDRKLWPLRNLLPGDLVILF